MWCERARRGRGGPRTLLQALVGGDIAKQLVEELHELARHARVLPALYPGQHGQTVLQEEGVELVRGRGAVAQPEAAYLVERAAHHLPDAGLRAEEHALQPPVRVRVRQERVAQRARARTRGDRGGGGRRDARKR